MECPHAARMVQESGELVCGCRRNRYAYEGKKQGKVAPLDLEVQLLSLEVQRIEQHPFDTGFGGPQHRARHDRVRVIVAAQTEQCAAARMERRRQTVEAAISHDVQSRCRFV